MSEASVTFVQVIVPGDCNGGKAVGSDEFLAEFKVKLTHTYGGCYAMGVNLKAYHRFYPDTTVAYPRGAEIKCYCFGPQEERTFFIRGGGAPGPNQPLKPKDPSAIELDPLQGDWPTFDLPRDHLELYAEVTVYECKRGVCQKDKCEALRTASLARRQPAGTGTQDGEGDTVIHPGDSPRIIIQGGAQAAGAVGGALKSSIASLPALPTEYELANIEDRVYRLERSRGVASAHHEDDNEG